jgi:hypothetical protein
MTAIRDSSETEGLPQIYRDVELLLRAVGDSSDRIALLAIALTRVVALVAPDEPNLQDLLAAVSKLTESEQRLALVRPDQDSAERNATFLQRLASRDVGNPSGDRRFYSTDKHPRRRTASFEHYGTFPTNELIDPAGDVVGQDYDAMGG